MEAPRPTANAVSVPLRRPMPPKRGSDSMNTSGMRYYSNSFDSIVRAIKKEEGLEGIIAAGNWQPDKQASIKHRD
jgi:hypothetical protein